MSEGQPNVLAVVGSLKSQSVTRVVIHHLAEKFSAAGCAVDILDLAAEPLDMFNPETTKKSASYPALQARVDKADVFIIGSPDYHGSISSPIKNFLDYFWSEFTGKLFVPVVASHEKGLTVIEQIRTIARQCYAWTLPYGVSAADKVDVMDGRVASKYMLDRLDMVARDARVYGALIARQRKEDLVCEDCSFLAKHRKR
jgi:NAD(P)H-dependent FMN reductase